MRQNAGPAALARLGASLALLLLMLVPALAGDRALIDLIGYSEDGRYFAFEEYGVQDGSGFAYSDVYVVDLPADKWLYGSPFNAQAEDEDTTLAEMRAAALKKAGDKLEETGITVPAEILALRGDGVSEGDGKTLGFSRPACCGPIPQGPEDYTLTLETFPADSPEDCVGLTGEKGLGYALRFDDGETVRELHRDAKLPKSRGCPLDYRLYAVVQPFEQTGSYVAIVSSYPFGFEGPDRRFLAVPIDQ
ncbi:MAG: DUF2259 domain-containing protein [Devosia sp.]|nr:DUF2259 domain-containing protein [Devosia sp.]